MDKYQYIISGQNSKTDSWTQMNTSTKRYRQLNRREIIESEGDTQLHIEGLQEDIDLCVDYLKGHGNHPYIKLTHEFYVDFIKDLATLMKSKY